MPPRERERCVDRFQRAAYYKAVLLEPKHGQEAMSGVLAIARNVSVPFGAPCHGFGIYNTEYRTAFHLTARRYFFELSNQPNVIWADLSKFDLKEVAPVMVLFPQHRIVGECDRAVPESAKGSFLKAVRDKTDVLAMLDT